MHNWSQSPTKSVSSQVSLHPSPNHGRNHSQTVSEYLQARRAISSHRVHEYVRGHFRSRTEGRNCKDKPEQQICDLCVHPSSSELCTPAVPEINACCLALIISYFLLLFQPILLYFILFYCLFCSIFSTLPV